MKYVIDIDLEENDCSFCPCFMRPEYSYAICNLAERDLESRLDTAEDGKNYVMCYDRPDWCPLGEVESSYHTIYIVYRNELTEIMPYAGSLEDAKIRIKELKDYYSTSVPFHVVEKTTFNRVVYKEE